VSLRVFLRQASTRRLGLWGVIVKRGSGGCGGQSQEYRGVGRGEGKVCMGLIPPRFISFEKQFSFLKNSKKKNIDHLPRRLSISLGFIERGIFPKRQISSERTYDNGLPRAKVYPCANRQSCSQCNLWDQHRKAVLCPVKVAEKKKKSTWDYGGLGFHGTRGLMKVNTAAIVTMKDLSLRNKTYKANIHCV